VVPLDSVLVDPAVASIPVRADSGHSLLASVVLLEHLFWVVASCLEPHNEFEAVADTVALAAAANAEVGAPADYSDPPPVLVFESSLRSAHGVLEASAAALDPVISAYETETLYVNLG
jgi:hypothetical protein